MRHQKAILQLDFDGTLVRGDVNETLFRRFAGKDWSERIEAASHELTVTPSSPALIVALQEASRHLRASDEECLAYAVSHNPPRDGLIELFQTAQRLGLEQHVVSYGFEFYVQHYLRLAGVDAGVEVHAGRSAPDGAGRRLSYFGPDGRAVGADWKVLWTQTFRRKSDVLIYAGDGGSDVAPAQLCDIVFARDTLLRRMPHDFGGTLRPFEDLLDIARGLEELLS